MKARIDENGNLTLFTPHWRWLHCPSFEEDNEVVRLVFSHTHVPLVLFAGSDGTGTETLENVNKWDRIWGPEIEGWRPQNPIWKEWINEDARKCIS